MRAQKKLLFERTENHDDLFSLAEAQKTKATIRQNEKTAQGNYGSIVAILRTFLARDENPLNLGPDEVLEKWLDESAISFLGGKAPAKTVSRIDREVNRVITEAGRLLSVDRDDDFLTALSELALGDVLYRSLKDVLDSEIDESVDVSISSQPMESVDVYLDSGVLFRTCGYFGDRHISASRELLDMAKRTGCHLKAFRHTIEEIGGGIAATASNLQLRPHEAWGPIGSYAMEHGLSPADLFLEAAMIESTIEGLGVEVVDKPPYDIPLVIDEKELDNVIETDVKQANPLARQRDVDSLASIYRLRHGKGKERLERCVAIFVTSNKTLSDACHRFFRKHFDSEGERNIVQICMTDVVFSTRLWTKLPSTYEWLP